MVTDDSRQSLPLIWPDTRLHMRVEIRNKETDKYWQTFLTLTQIDWQTPLTLTQIDWQTLLTLTQIDWQTPLTLTQIDW